MTDAKAEVLYELILTEYRSNLSFITGQGFSWLKRIGGYRLRPTPLRRFLRLWRSANFSGDTILTISWGTGEGTRKLGGIVIVKDDKTGNWHRDLCSWGSP